VVAGAGPAGVATAVALARAGVPADEIVCLDRARFPRPKPCGGGLTGHALAGLAALGLELRVPSAACDVGVLAFGRRRARVSLPAAVHVVRREELDADLVAQARALGIRVLEGEGVASFEEPRGADRVHVATTAGRRLAARVLVGADGAGSVVRRALLERADARKRQPIRLCRLEIPNPGLPTDRMLYDFSELAHGLRGYVWAFPVPGGRLNVGAMHLPAGVFGAGPAAGTLDAWLRRALARFGLSLPGPARGWPVWPYDEAAPIARGRTLLVGDAAGVDALTGEGIAVALEQGAVAADVIAAALGRGGPVDLGAYPVAVRRAPVGRELALDGVLARLLYGSPDPLLWLGLVMEDARMQALYAARVCGARVLADAKPELVRVLARHAFLGSARARRLAAAAVA
jgi:geranylgeranyl reductase family protein